MKDEEILSVLGKLAPLYMDNEITEIMVDAPTQILIEQKGKLVDADVNFTSTVELRTLINDVLGLGNVSLSGEQTSGHVYFPDGSRFMAVIPPTAHDSPNIVIRKTHPGQLDKKALIEFGSVTEEEYNLILSAIQSRQNMLISGGIASGKTTFANILSGEITDDERVVVVENTQEYQPRVKRLIRFAVENSPDHSFEDLLALAERMRPDRLLIGELRDGDAMHALNLFNIGHDGSMATIHARSVEDALARLETMCLMANLGLGLKEIRTLIASAIQVVTHQDRLPSGRRKVTQVTEILGLENGRYVLNPLFRYNSENDKIEATGAKASWE